MPIRLSASSAQDSHENSDEKWEASKLKKQRRRLTEHALTKPAELIEPQLRYEDMNPLSLAFALANGYPSAALWSDEAGMVTGCHRSAYRSHFVIGIKEPVTIVTSNLDFKEWDQAFPNNRLLAQATIDRLRHNAYCIELEGRSLRNPKVAPPGASTRVANGSKSTHS